MNLSLSYLSKLYRILLAIETLKKTGRITKLVFNYRNRLKFMSKQIFSSFKELQGLLPEIKTAQEKPVTIERKTKNSKSAKKAKKVNQLSSPTSPKSIQAAIARPIDQKLQAIFNALNWLKATFPAAFITPPAKVIALKIGIGQDIADYMKANASTEFSLNLVRKALAMYANNFRYLLASSKTGNPRIDLTGAVVDKVTEEQAIYAKNKLEQQKQRRLAKKVASEKLDAETIAEAQDVVAQQND